MGKLIVDNRTKGIAAINSKTGDVYVPERFNLLDKAIRRFIILQLTELASNKNTHWDTHAKIKADKVAIEILLKENPNVPVSYYVRELRALFAHEETPDANARLREINNIIHIVKP